MIEVSRQFYEKISVPFLHIIPKHEVSRLEAAVGSRCFILPGLSCGIVPPLFDCILNCSSTSVSASSNDIKNLSDDRELLTIEESETIVSVMIASNRISSNKRVSADLQPLHYRKVLRALRACSYLKRWSLSNFPKSLQAVLACS